MLSTLKWSTVVLLMALLAWLYSHYGKAVIDQWRPPRAQLTQDLSQLGQEIQRKGDLRRYNSFLRKYRRIERQLRQVRNRNFKVAPLKEKMEYALSLARQGHLEEAHMHLNLVEVRIPGRPESFKPAPSEGE